MPEFKHPFQEAPDKPPVLQRPRPFERGLVHVITGDGKGKSTAAFGMGLRAVGYGLHVHAVLFMKGDLEYGEFQAVRFLPHFTLARFGTPHLVDMNNPAPEDKEQARLGVEHARAALASGEYDMVICDEINVAVAWKLVPLEVVLDLIRTRPPSTELVLTGRYAPPALVAAADYVTEMRMVKHPYQQGIIARQGVDY